MSRYNCPHCGKFTGTTICRYCGKLTEGILKYRIMYLIGLVLIPLVTYFGHLEFQKVIRELVKFTVYVNLFAMLFVMVLFLAGVSVIFIIWQWIGIGGIGKI
ncbi:unnamed protein product [marine sediment metagenome]|uniref:Uncharacterized protein n=1 Tax=marine sediment metagenome TaxID=412755 RepID=X0ZGU6_9ZZZZ